MPDSPAAHGPGSPPEAPPPQPEERIGRESPLRRLAQRMRSRRVKTCAGWTAVGLLAVVLPVGGWYYVKFARIIDANLRAGPLPDTLNVFAAPESIAVGDTLTQNELVARLQEAGYRPSSGNRAGWFRAGGQAVEIFPGRDSYHDLEPAVVHFKSGKIARIVSLGDHTERKQYALAPQLLTNLSERTRAVRRPVRFQEIPASLVQAILSAEDKHFFRHSGFDLLRIGKAAWVDMREGQKVQGASTLTMQLVRTLWLEPHKSWRRKSAELLMTMHLERRLTKQEIFESYANEVYLGRRGTYSIHGFGEAALVYFGKEPGRLTMPEAATLAGMVQRPSYFNPTRHPERTRERRNLVLSLMRQNGFLTEAQRRQAAASPLSVSAGHDPASRAGAQYFLDLVNDDLQERTGDNSGGARDVYTTLDAGLQLIAREAVRAGMRQVDRLLRKQKPPSNQPQAALVALDPRTGEIKALVGGRDYAASQLNRALSRRQPGSVFKPFVFAAALDTAVEGGAKIFTPASTIEDEPTTFQFGGNAYSPGNFGGRFLGTVTLRRALVSSLNVATVKLAQQVGYAGVVSMARRCGMPANMRATPAVALGAYEASPLDVAGSYTVFANGGDYVQPALLSLVRARDGKLLYRHRPEPRRALDPRVTYLVVDLMQEVLRSGTGAGVRARGFSLPAAGKTGTSRDGWFAGFTSQLICVVWVGFDDNRDLKLEGAQAALPIWTEFMKRAHQLRRYRNAAAFQQPGGVVRAEICEESGKLASANCPASRSELFIEGTQPVVDCDMHATPDRFADRYETGTGGLPVLEPLPATAAP